METLYTDFMITHDDKTTTITCDKCKANSKAPNNLYNDFFFADGWALNKGRKYEHLCYGCLPAKKRRAMDKFRDMF